MLHVLTALSALLVGACGGVDWHSNGALGKAMLKLAKQHQVATSTIVGDGPSGTQPVDRHDARIIECFTTTRVDAFLSEANVSFGKLRGAVRHAFARSGYPPQLSA